MPSAMSQTVAVKISANATALEVGVLIGAEPLK